MGKITALFLYIIFIPVQGSIQHNLLKTDLVDDINFMIRSFEEIQVNPYLYISRKEFHRKTDSIIKLLPAAVSLNDAFVAVSQIAALLKDTHTYVDNFDEIIRNYEASGVFPVKVDPDKNFVITTAGKLKVGDSLLTINGYQARLLFRKSLNMQGGLHAYQINEAFNNFSYHLYLLNIKPPFVIGYRHSGKILIDTITGISFSDLNKASQLPNYSYQLLGDGIGYINFRSMSGGIKRFKHFLDSCFTDLKVNKAKGLIVDLRYNGGGNSDYGELLLSYLTDKPYRLSSGRYFKVSRQYQEFMSKNYADKSSKEVIDYLKAAPGNVRFYQYKTRNYMADNPNRYQLRTFFLIGPQNLSSATMLADGAQTYKIARLIGEPTGAPANDGGESYNFQLPYSHFDVYTSSTYDIRANGNSKERRAVLPDIFIREQPNKTKDTILSYAMKEIVRKKRQAK